MDVKLIRANRDIHVPMNPEKIEGQSFRSVQKGLLALIPSEYKLPSDAYEDLGVLKAKAKKKKRD